MRSWMLARASPATGPLGEITRGREKFTQRVGIDGEGRREPARLPASGMSSALFSAEYLDGTGYAFLRAHWGAIAAADFFTVEIWTRTGLRRYFVFFVMDLVTRNVEVAGITAFPSGV